MKQADTVQRVAIEVLRQVESKSRLGAARQNKVGGEAVLEKKKG
jgi:hypothetical protein